MISASLLPWRSMARVSRRRSTARPAFESAIVWFWQTRQRSSAVMRVMRASSAGSAASGSASFAPASAAESASSSATIALQSESGIELLQQRLDLVRQHVGRQRADVLQADDAVLVDDEGLGHAVDAEVDADPALDVVERGVVRIAEAGQPAGGVLALVLVVEAVERHHLLLRELDQQRMLLAAGDAPRGPDVEHPDLAAHVVESDRPAGVVEPRQGELRRRLVDQGRGHLARIELQADREHDSQGQEGGERDEK